MSLSPDTSSVPYYLPSQSSSHGYTAPLPFPTPEVKPPPARPLGVLNIERRVPFPDSNAKKEVAHHKAV